TPALQRPNAPVEARPARPQRLDHLQRLVRAVAAVAKAVAGETELDLVPADADAEVETAAGEEVERSCLPGDAERVVHREQHDRGADPNPLHAAGDPGERRNRVERPP